MFDPKNEQGVVFLFAMGIKEAGWEIMEIGMPFPDATLRIGGDVWKVEFEYLSSNFVAHGHDYRECDLIICWQDDLADCPLPVLCLSVDGWEKHKPTKGNPLVTEIQFWKSRASKLERELNKVKSQIFKPTPRKFVRDENKLKHRRLCVLVAASEVSKKSELNFAEIGRTHGVSDTMVRKDLSWLEESGFWLNHDNWEPTDKGREWISAKVGA